MPGRDQGLHLLVENKAFEAVRVRRDLHRHPEIGWSERRTTIRISENLRRAGLGPIVRSDGIGLHVDIGGGTPVVGFRADIDALPIDEENDVPYRSQVPGLMHACGHDAHAAIACGIAGVLAARDDLPAAVRVIFQPAEEQLPSGAATLASEGVLDGLGAMLAFHIDPSLDAPHIGVKTGPVTSAADKLVVRIHGPGGHTSRPHQTVDLVQVAARIVFELPNRLRAEVDPLQNLVAVFGRIRGGRAENVIPTLVEVGGTVRVPDVDLWRRLPKLVGRIVAEIASPLGATVEVDYSRGSPPVVNDAGIVAEVAEAATVQFGNDAAVATHQSMGSEDFAWYLEHLPGAMVRLGAKLPDRETDLHSSTFDLDEAAVASGIETGVASLLRLARVYG